MCVRRKREVLYQYNQQLQGTKRTVVNGNGYAIARVHNSNCSDKGGIGVAEIIEQHVDLIASVGDEGEDTVVKALKLKRLAIKAHHMGVWVNTPGGGTFVLGGSTHGRTSNGGRQLKYAQLCAVDRRAPELLSGPVMQEGPHATPHAPTQCLHRWLERCPWRFAYLGPG